jgi:hypothetical protein
MPNDCGENNRTECDGDPCVSNHEAPAQYYVNTDGKRLCLCYLCWIQREHRLIKERQAGERHGMD